MQTSCFSFIFTSSLDINLFSFLDSCTGHLLSVEVCVLWGSSWGRSLLVCWGLAVLRTSVLACSMLTSFKAAVSGSCGSHEYPLSQFIFIVNPTSGITQKTHFGVCLWRCFQMFNYGREITLDVNVRIRGLGSQTEQKEKKASWVQVTFLCPFIADVMWPTTASPSCHPAFPAMSPKCFLMYHFLYV